MKTVDIPSLMFESRTFNTPKEFMEQNFPEVLEFWEDFIAFVNDFEDTNGTMDNLDPTKIEQYALLFWKKLDKSKKWRKTDCAGDDGEYMDTLDSKEKEFIKLSHSIEEKEEVEEVFEFECKNQVRISDLFEQDFAVVVQDIKKGNLLNSDPVFTFFAFNPQQDPGESGIDLRAERSLTEVHALFNSLKSSYPASLVESLGARVKPPQSALPRNRD